jgi:AraC family transcriptional regulator of adaptative response / DNA-3-methyladenine glycosylase II
MAPVDSVSRLVNAAIAGIEEHALSSAHVGDLAASLGVTDRHLRRVTEMELGVSPIQLAQTQRLLLAKRLLK